jgi:hypothetical protein
MVGVMLLRDRWSALKAHVVEVVVVEVVGWPLVTAVLGVARGARAMV